MEKQVDYAKATHGLIWVFANMWASTVYPFTRHSFGLHYFSRYQWCGWIILYMYGLFQLPYPIEPFRFMWYAVPILWIARRAQAHRQEVAGTPEHTHYSGFPYLCQLLGISERVAKCHVEPFAVMLAGLAFMAYHPPFGLYILIAGICCLLDAAATYEYRRNIARSARDSMLEQRFMAEDMRR